MTKPLICTNVSEAYFCSPGGEAKIAQISVMKNPSGNQELAWLDNLLDGGFYLPSPVEQRPSRALTVLLAGPPGAGKSTLALEICARARLFRDGVIRDNNTNGEMLQSLYVTSESSSDWLGKKIDSYGWNVQVATGALNSRDPALRYLQVLESTDFKFNLEGVDPVKGPMHVLVSTLSNLLKPIYPIVESGPEILKTALEADQKRRIKALVEWQLPHILVVDSLNTLDQQDRGKLFQRFASLIQSGPLIIFIVLDTVGPSGNAEFWSYFADVIIRLDRKTSSDYLVRTLEIEKARYQQHVWGAHQLKIYAPSSILPENRSRYHPYREQGGIFIFPSIHYYLSAYKRMSPRKPPEPIATGLPGLDHVLKGGFPKGRCVGFMGCRGGHKSHLGYLHILHRLKESPLDKALLISLRDDEGTARKTLDQIQVRELGSTAEVLNEYMAKDRLEILHYQPGYITPEEFFHRMFMSIHRLKGKNCSSLTVLFNSLDQLSSRFPLCARQEIFVPGIIETLSAEEITSIFVGVEEPGQPPEQYGLLSMADLILSFKQRPFPRETYLGCLTGGRAAGTESDGNPGNQNAITLEVVRYSGGQAAGGGGLLELVTDGDRVQKLTGGGAGLRFFPFPDGFSSGRVTDAP